MKFLVVGGGSIGQRHLRNLKSLNYSELYCFKREFSKEFSTEFNCKVLITIKEVELLKPDVILICNPTALHETWIEISDRLNAAVFVEKPMIHSQKGLNNILKSWTHKNVFFIGFMLRFHPLVKKVKELIDSKKIGEVYSSRLEFGSWLPYWHPWEDYKTSYASLSKMGGGVINTITHELDLAQYFFGNPERVKSVKANFSILDINVEELAESILVYNDKLVTLHVDYLQKDYDRNIKILGTKGKILWNWHENAIKISLHNDLTETYELNDFDVNQLYIDELTHFINLVQKKIKLHDLDFNHAVDNTKLMLNIHESCNKDL